MRYQMSNIMLRGKFRRTLIVGLIAAGLWGCASQQRELMPTPVLYQDPSAQAVFEEVPAERRTSYVDLLYFTDRVPKEDSSAGLSYGESRSRSLGFGAARVALLPERSWDELRRASLAEPREERIILELGAVNEIGRYPSEPYHVQVTADGLIRDPSVVEHHDRATASLQSEVERRLQSSPTGEVMLYVHGYNETFARAAETAAELCHFLGRVHVCSLFTWPTALASEGALTSYISTTESALYSVGHLKKTIRTLAQIPGVEELHLLAHSRGTALLLNAVRELSLENVAAGESPAEAQKLRNLVLLSPDIDVDVFQQQLAIFASDPELTTRWTSPYLPEFVRGRFTIYASPNDKALGLSEYLFRSRFRVGQLSPGDVTENVQEYFAKLGNVDVIVYEGKRTDHYGHSYFASNPRVSSDLIELVRNGTLPGDPGRPLTRRGRMVWVFAQQ